jgi:hypothetical protein
MLQTRCPDGHCGRTLSALPAHSRTGFCPHCNRWLGSAERIPAEENILGSHGWITDTIGQMLQHTVRLTTPPKSVYFAPALMNHLEEKCASNVSALARQLNMSPKSVRQLADGRQRPQLGTILKVSSLLATMPIDLLTGNHKSPSDIISPAINLTSNKQRPHRRFDRSHIRELLQHSLDSAESPPPSMASVAKRLGYNQSFLYRHFPDRCRAISARHSRFRSEEADRRAKEL